MDAKTATMVEYLQQTLALEHQLTQTLATHASETPEGEYRDLLDRHRDETVAHAQRLQQRLQELGAHRSLPALGFGLLQEAAHQAIALATAPLSLVRGLAGEEQLVRNARDEFVSEANEVALYDILEALADELGDSKTAVLAREHRRQELEFSDDLRDTFPDLVGALVRARTATEHERRSPSSPPEGLTRKDEDADEAAQAIVDRTQDARVPDARLGIDHGGETLPLDLPIAGYDGLTVAQILPRLEKLSADELAAVEGYEHAGRARKQLLDRLAALRHRATDDLLERLS
jgi:ferritin-like metal-binding protein YciE